MRVLKRLTATALAILLAMVCAGCNSANPKEIDVIYVWYNTFGEIYLEYKVDLKTKKLWEYSTGLRQNYIARNETAENEGFDFVRGLEEHKVKDFQYEAMFYGLARWQEEYRVRQGGTIVEDYWYIKVIFSDGTTKSSYGNGTTVPLTWDRMYCAFERLTGEKVLQYKDGWWRHQ